MHSSLTILSGLLTLLVSAHPATHGNLHGRATADLSQYANKLSSSFVQAADIPGSIKIPAGSSYVERATNLVKSTFPKATFRLVGDHYTSSNGLSHVNFKQTANGHDIDDANFHVNVKPDGSILSYGHSFYTGAIPNGNIPSLVGLVQPVAALTSATTLLGLPIKLGSVAAHGSANSYNFSNVEGVVSQPKADLVYMQNPANKNVLVPTWRVETDVGHDWLLTYVGAVGASNIHSVTNYAADVGYNVLPYPVTSPALGNVQIVENPENLTASPLGWLNGGFFDNYTVTRGNNAVSQYAPQGEDGTNYLTSYKPQLIFDEFNYYYSSGLYTPSSYANASAVQMFYSANKIHDILYLLGFNEVSGNFQNYNFGKGGQGFDFVILYAQDGTGQNNAYFSTPPDGQNGRMATFVFTFTNPPRDSSFDLDVVWHEYAHGLSNRLTGGAGNSGCLNTNIARGLGEGWSDFYAYAATLTYYDSRYTNAAQGAWVSGKPGGARPYPYSVSFYTNPQTFSYLNRYTEVHDIGSVWATILYGMYWDLIDRYGNSNNYAYPAFDSRGTATDGRYLAMQLVLEGMKLQPCNPDFFQARDAIISADSYQTGGVNYCTLWNAFSVRGLGVGAYINNNGKYVDNYDVPTSCNVE